MIVAHELPARATLAVVSLGASTHLEACLASLAAHVSKTDFRVLWVNNDDGSGHTARAVPPGVLTINVDSNLGWAGGLHVARANSNSEFLVWIQEDMEVQEGWLDALVDAADAHPEFSAFGSLAVDAEGQPAGFAGGTAYPARDVTIWNDTDTTATSLPNEVTPFDWITSKGLLTRTEAWDEIGGADPRWFPLNHVDKDYCTHLRAHGRAVALVPSARLFHLGSQSAPSHFRRFIAGWQEPRFNAQWGDIVAELATRPGPIAHSCHDWLPEHGDPVDHVRAAAGAEAARMLVPFARWITETRNREEREALQLTTERFHSSASWKATAPLRSISRLLARRRSSR